MAILEEIGNFLKRDSNLEELASYLDTSTDEVKRPVGAAVSLMVGAVAKRSRSETGASAMFDTVKGAGGSALEHVGAPFDQPDRLSIGEELVDGILGARRTEIESGLAQKSGMATGQIQKLLPALAPAVIGAMGRRVSQARLSRSALVGELEADRSLMEREGLSSLLGLLDGGDEETDSFNFAEVMNRLNASGGMQALLPAAMPVQRAGDGTEEPVFTSINTTPGVTGDSDIAQPAGDPGYVDAGYNDGGIGRGYAQEEDTSFYGSPVDRRWAWILGGVLALLLLLLLLWQCGGDDGTEDAATATPTPSVGTDGGTGDGGTTGAPAAELIDGQLLSVAQSLGTFTELVASVQDVGLADELEGPGPFTLFAPTDEAFRALPPEIRDDRTKMQQILTYHLVPGVVNSESLVTGDIGTVAGETISIEVGEQVRLNGALVTLADTAATNGVIHVIDQVLLPPSLQTTGTTTPGAPIAGFPELAPIAFASGSVEVSAEAQTELNKVAEFLLANPQAVEIQGHTDSTGDAAQNQTLSEQRANAVRTYLVDIKGVDGTLLTAVGYGSTLPLLPEDTAAAANRRIEFVSA